MGVIKAKIVAWCIVRRQHHAASGSFTTAIITVSIIILLQVMCDLAHEYGDIVHIRMGPFHTVCLNSLASINEALSTEEFSGRPTVFYTLNIITSNNKGRCPTL